MGCNNVPIPKISAECSPSYEDEISNASELLEKMAMRITSLKMIILVHNIEEKQMVLPSHRMVMCKKRIVFMEIPIIEYYKKRPYYVKLKLFSSEEEKIQAVETKIDTALDLWHSEGFGYRNVKEVREKVEKTYALRAAVEAEEIRFNIGQRELARNFEKSIRATPHGFIINRSEYPTEKISISFENLKDLEKKFKEELLKYVY